MAGDGTIASELATALGMTGHDNVVDAMAARPSELRVGDGTWEQLTELHGAGRHAQAFERGFSNGRAFLEAPDALCGRPPRLIEWTGGRRAPGDEVVPADLRVDHVYLVSCKYLSKILHNPSPARLVEGLLSHAPVDDRSDWYQRVAPDHHQALYDCCRAALPAELRLPPSATQLTPEERRALAGALKVGWPGRAARAAYAGLCSAVACATADRWRANLTKGRREPMLWRLLRIGAAPYFVLGADRAGSMRLRVATPWDWRERFRLRTFDVAPHLGGQPLVRWTAAYHDRLEAEDREVCGHIEVRWSHGRFRQPPEAKVYLDTPHAQVGGYFPLVPPGVGRVLEDVGDTVAAIDSGQLDLFATTPDGACGPTTTTLTP